MKFKVRSLRCSIERAEAPNWTPPVPHNGLNSTCLPAHRHALPGHLIFDSFHPVCLLKNFSQGMFDWTCRNRRTPFAKRATLDTTNQTRQCPPFLRRARLDTFRTPRIKSTPFTQRSELGTLRPIRPTGHLLTRHTQLDTSHLARSIGHLSPRQFAHTPSGWTSVVHLDTFQPEVWPKHLSRGMFFWAL